MNPFFELWINMMRAAVQANPTPEQRRAAFVVVQGGKAAA